MSSSALIKEIFTSIQGEGLYVGAKQLFIRFSGCNLKCNYCDTNHEQGVTCYTPVQLVESLNNYDLENLHSISFTGGEPLLHAVFLEDFLPLCAKKVYLETNGTLLEPFAKLARFVDIAAVDIKLDSVSNQGALFKTHDTFIALAVKNNIETFAKVIFDNNIDDGEIKECCAICKKHSIPLIIQPKMTGNKMALCSDELIKIFDKFLFQYQDVRLIPQVHKFMCVE